MSACNIRACLIIIPIASSYATSCITIWRNNVCYQRPHKLAFILATVLDWPFTTVWLLLYTCNESLLVCMAALLRYSYLVFCKSARKSLSTGGFALWIHQHSLSVNFTRSNLRIESSSYRRWTILLARGACS